MKNALVVLISILIFTVNSAHALPTLFEMHTWSQGGYDAVDVNLSAFDAASGLGTVTMTFSGAGINYGGLYVDHELNEGVNTFFNESGGMSIAAAAAGTTWQIDEPGFGNRDTGYTGTIFGNFGSNALNNTIFDGTFTGPEDVAMAMIRSFDLGAGGTATLSFTLSDTLLNPNAFYLQQTDGGIAESIYFSSNLEVRGTGPEPVPEPSTMILLGAGLLALGAYARKHRQA